MKVILTGCTGLIGSNVLDACLTHPTITSIVALSRHQLPATASSNPKLKVIIMADFGTYPTTVLDAVADADACIWAIGTSDGNHLVRIDYPLAFATALARIRAKQTTALRFVHLSGAVSEVDQSKPLWYMQEARRVGGLGEKALRDFADRKENLELWEGYTVRPGYVYSKNSAGWIGMLLGANYAVREDALATVMVDIAVSGAADRVLENKTVIARAKQLVGEK
ncbi:hypothetical protein MMC18_005740 [Xylographa bjoerkii]|nr:hypothetical protein [Xylographa bjoerkii]